MKPAMTLLWTLILLVGINNGAAAIPFRGVEFPDGEISFADKVVDYIRGGGVSDFHADPSKALGVSDSYPVDETSHEGVVSLGTRGQLVLEFTDNSLTTSGDNALDLWIFEVGAIEPTSISISTDGIDWIEVGLASGSTSGIDIDAYIGYGVLQNEYYSFVKLTDMHSRTGYPYTGADIDAVGAISSGPSAIPEPGTIFLLSSGVLGLAGIKIRRDRTTAKQHS